MKVRRHFHSQIFEGVAGKEGVIFFREGSRGKGVGCSYEIKNKLKSEIFNFKGSL